MVVGELGRRELDMGVGEGTLDDFSLPTTAIPQDYLFTPLLRTRSNRHLIETPYIHRNEPFRTGSNAPFPPLPWRKGDILVHSRMECSCESVEWDRVGEISFHCASGRPMMIKRLGLSSFFKMSGMRCFAKSARFLCP